MTYATIAQFEEEWGTDALIIVADRDDDDAIDIVVVQAALDRAASKMDGYIGVGYVLPLEDTHEVLVSLNCDIAMYMLSSKHDQLTDNKTARYKDAISTLRLISKGEYKLEVSQHPKNGNRGGAVRTGEDRVMTRDNLSGW